MDILKVLKGGKYTYKEIAKLLNIKKSKARREIQKLKENGYSVISEYTRKGKLVHYLQTDPIESEDFIYIQKPKKIGIVSDTHLGSKYCALKKLKEFYKILEDEGVDVIIHAGDLTDGNGRVYKGQLNEVYVYGFDDMLDYVVNEYPESSVKTMLISGNHDDSFLKSEGANIVKMICEQRDDLQYLGSIAARLKDYDNDFLIEVVHSKGQTPYARSYKAQKQLEQMVEKPDLSIRGHLQTSMFLPYLESNVFEAGCFQEQTPFLKRMGLYPQVGGWIVEIGEDRIKPVWYSYKE